MCPVSSSAQPKLIKNMAMLTLMKKEACSCKNHFPNKEQPFSIHQEADTKKVDASVHCNDKGSEYLKVQ
ncbi:hypothetical protein NC651_036175 [Populus alba x Populus x berolinensis]|nr:hypothetical protein NC651_036175 [Populus alba x Populus x berolinensis]